MAANSKVKYFLSAILSVSIWGFFSIPLRSLKAFDPQEILYYRTFISLAVIWLVILVFRKAKLRADLKYYSGLTKEKKRTFITQNILSSILLTLNWLTFIYAVNNVSLTSAAFAYMVCPLITAFGGFILLKEKLSKIQLFSLAVALLSIGLLATGSIIEVTWSVVIATLYAFYLIIQRKMQHVDKLNALALQFIMSVMLMLPFYLMNHKPVPEGMFFWGNITLIAILFTIFPLFLSLYALVGIPSSTLGIIIYL
ncbi:MAG: permease, partial [Pedobacter sp.]